MGRAGYDHRGEQGIPGREFFRRGQPRSHHLHLVVHGSPLWLSHVAFRDRLRADRALADEYAALKRALAQRHPHDREAYTDAKAPFISGVLSAPGEALRAFRPGRPRRR